MQSANVLAKEQSGGGPRRRVRGMAASRARHWAFLGAASLVVIAALSLRVLPDERVALRFLPRFPLPQACFSRLVLGVPCPGCGLTRSFVHLADGQFARAWQTNRVGLLLAGAVMFQFPYRLLAILSRDRWRLHERIAHAFVAVIAVLLIGNWILRLIGS
jgi:hypothetical protein